MKEAKRDDEPGPGLPLLRTWRAVYWFVFGCCVAYIGLLTLLTRAFA